MARLGHRSNRNTNHNPLIRGFFFNQEKTGEKNKNEKSKKNKKQEKRRKNISQNSVTNKSSKHNRKKRPNGGKEILMTYEIKSLFNRKKTKGQEFKRPIIKKHGKEIDLYNEIQANTEDTEIYKIFEKYNIMEGGHIPEDKLNAEKELVFGDITAIQEETMTGGHINITARNEKLKETWNRLPLQIREEMGFDINKLETAAQKYAQQGGNTATNKAEKSVVNPIPTTGNDALNSNNTSTKE